MICGKDDAYLKDAELLDWSKQFSFPTIIGSLIHAMVHTRPDIAYAVAILSRSMSCPELWHWKAARYLLLYLRETAHLGLVYRQEVMLAQEAKVTAATDEHDQFLEAAVDASFADCDKTYRSTSGFVVWFGGSPVEWECKRQPLVTLSTMESEYVAASKCVCSIRFLHKLLDFVNLGRKGSTKIHEDNSACIAITSKPVHRSRSKHIGVKYHNVREASQNNEVELVQVWTEHQVADIFTKSLHHKDFVRCREVLMGRQTFDEMVKAHVKPEAPKVNSIRRKCYERNTKGQKWPKFIVPQSSSFCKDTSSLYDCILGKPQLPVS